MYFSILRLFCDKNTNFLSENKIVLLTLRSATKVTESERCRESKFFVLFASSFLRIPLHKHKSMREALREKGIELPYQDPARKYQPEFYGSANMYINNYADVRNPMLTHFYILYTTF